MNSNYKILIVEDDPQMLLYLKKLLIQNDFTIYAAKDGLEGLEKLKEKYVDLIISDIVMPNMNGYEFYKKIISNSKWIKIPFIFLTSKANGEDVQFGKELGIDDYIIKTAPSKELIATIKGKIKKAELLNAEIESKDKKLSELAFNLAEKNELIKKLYEEIAKFKEESDALKDKSEKEFLENLKEVLYTKEDWRKFEDLFNNAYPNFIPTLKEKFPDLTRQELRVSALIKIGLSTSETAKVLYISKRSVENHRYHIRKKINISSKRDLYLFLNSLI